jgi:hypothetical protein
MCAGIRATADDSQPQEVAKFLRSEPFRPFRLTMTDGRTYTIEHPELMMVGRTTAEVGVRSQDFAAIVYDHTVTISLLRVMQIEVLPESWAN